MAADNLWNDDCEGDNQLHQHITYEPPRDKTNNVVVRPAKTQISLGIRPVWSVFVVCTKKGWLPIERTAKALMRLGGCPGWSESSLDAQPHCWFCQEAAHISEILHLARKPRIIFQSPECFTNKTNFLILMGIFTNFDRYMVQKSKFRQKLSFMMRRLKIPDQFSPQPGKIFLEKWSPCM